MLLVILHDNDNRYCGKINNFIVSHNTNDGDLMGSVCISWRLVISLNKDWKAVRRGVAGKENCYIFHEVRLLLLLLANYTVNNYDKNMM